MPLEILQLTWEQTQNTRSPLSYRSCGGYGGCGAYLAVLAYSLQLHLQWGKINCAAHYKGIAFYPGTTGLALPKTVLAAEVCSAQDVPRGGLISSCTHHTFTRFISQSDANAEIAGQCSGLGFVWTCD